MNHIVNMKYIYKFFYRFFQKEKGNEFKKEKFMYNNFCILTLTFFLTLEQLFYGFCLSESGGLLQKIYFNTAFVMAVYFIFSGCFQIKKVKKISWLHKVYEISFGFFGFVIAILRALIVQNNIFTLPIIYIAVIYGFAVFFYFSPFVSFCLYCLTCTSIIILLPIFQPEIIHFTYVQDIVSNNIIAWIASIISYRRYVKEYRSQRIISNKNELLQAKTSKIEKKNEVLRYISNVDSLTNIYNRRKLDEILEIEYDRCNIFNREISLILMDVDLFKSINDTYGHNVGDKVLIEIGEILRNNVRKSDKVGRWGGEEFLIICPETNFEGALYIAEKIRKTIEAFDFRLEKNVTCSFGVSTNKEIDTIKDLILRADMGLYKAKGCGRNRVERGN